MKKAKKLLSATISVLLLLCTIPAFSVSAEENVTKDFKYTINENEITITEYIGQEKDLDIPDNAESMSPEEIEEYYKENILAVISVEIPEKIANKPVTKIGKEAFQSKRINKISIPATVTSIGESAFSSSALQTVTIPEGVCSIESNAFSGCSSLEEVQISSSVTSIASNAFGSCYNLSKINIAPDNPVYDSRDNCNAIIETSTNSLIKGCNSTFIPNGIVTICDSALKFCKIKEISIPDSVDYIGEDVFLACNQLTKVNVDPNNLFYDSRNNCNAIIETGTNTLIYGFSTSTIPYGVSTIATKAFNFNDQIKEIVIPESVTKINEMAFYYCDKLTDIYYTESQERWNRIIQEEDYKGEKPIPSTVNIHYNYVVPEETANTTETVNENFSTVSSGKSTNDNNPTLIIILICGVIFIIGVSIFVSVKHKKRPSTPNTQEEPSTKKST